MNTIYISVIHLKIHALLEKENTGNLNEFAEQLSVPKIILNQHLSMLSANGVKIGYSKAQQTFKYMTTGKKIIDLLR